MTMMSNKDTCPTDAQDDPRARDLLRRAFEKTARWPADFNGFSADLIINVDGQEFTGAVTVKSAQDVTVSVLDAEVQQWATGTISMIVVHRAYRTFDQSDGKSVLTLDRRAAHPLEQTIRNHDSLHSHDRVSDARITQHNRTIGRIKFTINAAYTQSKAEQNHRTTR